MLDCTNCDTTFNPERDTTGSSTRCPSCGTDHDDVPQPRSDGGSDATHLRVTEGTTVRITIEILPDTAGE